MHPFVLLDCDVQLHAESRAEDGEQHGGVAAEDRTVSDGQYRCRYRSIVEAAQREAYL